MTSRTEGCFAAGSFAFEGERRLVPSHSARPPAGGGSTDRTVAPPTTGVFLQRRRFTTFARSCGASRVLPARIDDVHTPVYVCCEYNICGWYEANRGQALASTRVRERQPRDVTINLRANQRQRALIDRAAETLGKNRSDFMLEVACREADAVLLDRRFFLVDEKAYKRFAAALDRPPADNPKLRRLLASKAPWER